MSSTSFASYPADSESRSYTPIAKILHWTTAILVLGNLALGLNMEQFPGFKDGTPDWDARLFIHGSIGALIFWLTVVRFGWRSTHPAPAEPAYLGFWQKTAARVVHASLYFLLLALPLTGYAHRIAGKHPVSFFGLFDWPVVIDGDEPLRVLSGSVHVALALLLIALITVHFGAVIKHLVIDRDNILRRML